MGIQYSILTIIILFSQILDAATQVTERRLWRRGLAGECSYYINVEGVHINCRLTSIYMVHVALSYRVAATYWMETLWRESSANCAID